MRILLPFRLATLIALSALGFACLPSTGRGQSVLGIGDDALVLPRGTFRLDVRSQWTFSNERYSAGNAGQAPQGTLEPIGGFDLDSAGVSTFPALAPLQTGLRALTGISDLDVSLGRLTARTNSRVSSVPIAIEYGVSHRLLFNVTVPIIKTHSEVTFAANPEGGAGNVGVNPALSNAGALSADTMFANQMLRAADAVQSYCAGAGASQSECTNSAALVSQAQAFAQGISDLYPSSQFVPVVGSNVQTAIDTRASTLTSSLNTFANISGSGVPQITASGVVAATPLTTPEAQTFFTDSAYGFRTDSIATIEHISLGDIELGAKYLLFDSFHDNTKARMQPHGFNSRFALGGMLRFPTGKVDSPDNFFDIGTGTHAWGAGIRAYGDVLIGSHFWTSIVTRYTAQFSNDEIVRVPTMSTQVIVPYDTRTPVSRKLGNIIEIEATPRWVINDFLALSAQYLYRHKGQDEYTSNDASSTADLSVLSEGTELTEQRVGGGISFSNLRAANEGKAHIPFEVTYLHFQTVSGSNGNVPKLFGDQIRIRLYASVFGH
jgi:hypothetical protein